MPHVWNHADLSNRQFRAQLDRSRGGSQIRLSVTEGAWAIAYVGYWVCLMLFALAHALTLTL